MENIPRIFQILENVPHILQLQGVYKTVSITELSTCRLNFPPAVGSPFMKNVVFVVFTTTKRNQALLSHVYGKMFDDNNQPLGPLRLWQCVLNVSLMTNVQAWRYNKQSNPLL